MRLREWPWLAGLLSIAVGALWFSHGWLTAPVKTNDSYQYLDAASSVASGGCLCTEVAFFDDQVATGQLPVALTHFAPGYPLLIAGLSKLGPDLETAGYAISAAGFLLSILLIWQIGLMLGATRLATSVAILLWIFNSSALTYASAVLTESLFTAVLTALMALVAKDLKSEGKNPRLLPAIGGLAGAAYCLRYAGLLLIPPVLLYLVWRWWRNREFLPWVLSGAIAICCFVLPIQVRNIVEMGSWRGVLLTHTSHNPAVAIIPVVAALYWLVLGGYPFLSLGIWLGSLLAAGLMLLVLALKAWRKGAWGRPGRNFPIFAWICLFGLIYTGGVALSTISLANMTFVGRDLSRLYVPLYPVFLVCLGGLVSGVRSTALCLMMVLLASVILMSQARDLSAQPGPRDHAVIASGLAKEVARGESLRQWVLSHVPPGTPIVSEEGQALRHLLQRPVVSIIEPPEFSNRATDGPAFRDLMSKYKSRYLLLFPTVRDSQNRLPFLQGLILGKRPDWLKLSLRTHDVVLYECEPCTR